MCFRDQRAFANNDLARPFSRIADHPLQRGHAVGDGVHSRRRSPSRHRERRALLRGRGVQFQPPALELLRPAALALEKRRLDTIDETSKQLRDLESSSTATSTTLYMLPLSSKSAVADLPSSRGAVF